MVFTRRRDCLLRQVSQHRVEDSAVAVVLHFYWRIDADGARETLRASVVRRCRDGDR